MNPRSLDANAIDKILCSTLRIGDDEPRAAENSALGCDFARMPPTLPGLTPPRTQSISLPRSVHPMHPVHIRPVTVGAVDDRAPTACTDGASDPLSGSVEQRRAQQIRIE